MIIGLSGYARSGKDSVARVLVDEYGYKRVAFADKLREFLYALNPIVKISREHFAIHEWGTEEAITVSAADEVVRLQVVVDYYGWDEIKSSPYGDEVRVLLQRLGTEAGRGVLGENVWVDAALKGIQPDDKIVVTDMRFPNEYDAIIHHHGLTWRIDRTGVGPANDHESEISLDNHRFHALVPNHGSLKALETVVEKLVKWYGLDS